MQLRAVSIVETPSQAVRRQCIDEVTQFAAGVLGREELPARLLELEPVSKTGAAWIRTRDERIVVETMSWVRQNRSVPLRREPAPEVTVAAVMGRLQQHRAAWPDVALPALQGRTRRAAVETLLRDFENSAARGKAQGQTAYDFSRLRQEQGME